MFYNLGFEQTVEKDSDEKDEEKREKEGRVEREGTDTPEMVKKLQDIEQINPGGDDQRSQERLSPGGKACRKERNRFVMPAIQIKRRMFVPGVPKIVPR